MRSRLIGRPAGEGRKVTPDLSKRAGVGGVGKALAWCTIPLNLVQHAAFWGYQRGDAPMAIRAVPVLYVVAMIAVVVGMDVLFFRHQVWERLAANVGIILVFAAFYFRFLKGP